MKEKIVRFVDETIRTSSPGIIFVRRKDRAKELAAALEEGLGREVPWVTSEVPQAKRDGYIAAMRDGSMPVVVATSAWSTGVDIPELRWVAFADKGRAPIWFTQATVRGARIADGKTEFDIYDIRCEDSLERMGHVSDYTDEEVLKDLFSSAERRGHSCRGTPRRGAPRRGTPARAQVEYRWWLIITIILIVLYVTCKFGGNS